MNTVEDVLALDPELLHDLWGEVDRVVQDLPSWPEQIHAWEQIRQKLDERHSPQGHPFFRLGVLHLLEDSSEEEGLNYLELAYKEDQKHAEEGGIPAEEKAAYRLLAIAKDFFTYLRSKKEQDWESALLLEENRKVLVSILLTVYNLSRTHALDMPGFTTLDFLKLIKNDALRRFAGENYFCAERLLQQFTLEGQHIDKNNDQYPLGRATVGLFGGVLEAIWLDRVPSGRVGTLGRLLAKAHKQG
ncbi:MAG: hypothetical protein ACRD2L_19880, partial [Terriglobia bacterium]